MNMLLMADVVGTIHKLPSLPVVVSSLLASLAQDDVSVDVLAKNIGSDQALRSVYENTEKQFAAVSLVLVP